MVYIQLNLPKDLDREVDIESAKTGIKDKRIVILNILMDHFRKEEIEKKEVNN